MTEPDSKPTRLDEVREEEAPPDAPGESPACPVCPAPEELSPRIIPRPEHNISRSRIDSDALKILYRLQSRGFKAYLVGGGVRDLLLGGKPKDFDIATDARPGQVKKLFRTSRLIGRRFKLVHVRFKGNKVIEVATFRRAPTLEELTRFGAENTFGTPRQDALRRDFTVNALFYNIADFSVIDWVGGLEDMEANVLKVVGQPDLRFPEDPVRMLRALEFSARLGFTLDPPAAESIRRHCHLIQDASRMRLREEVYNLFLLGVARPVFEKACDLGFYAWLMPGIPAGERLWRMIDHLDTRATTERKKLELWSILSVLHLEGLHEGHPWSEGGSLAETEEFIENLIQPFTHHYGIGAHTRHIVREHLLSLWRIGRGPGHRGEMRFRRREIFRPSIDLFRTWTEITGEDQEILAAWDVPERPRKKKKKRKKRRRRRPKDDAAQPKASDPAPDQQPGPRDGEFPDTSGRW